MKKQWILAALLTAGLQLGFAGAASAAYLPGSDITLNVLTGSSIKPSSSTGDASFQLQEGAHQLLKDKTGTEVDHSYIWINVNGTPILAVDPPKPCF